jgi:hypothetical protein
MLVVRAPVAGGLWMQSTRLIHRLDENVKKLAVRAMRSTGYAYPFAAIATELRLICALPGCWPLNSKRCTGGFIFE